MEMIAKKDPLFERLKNLRPNLATHIRLTSQHYRGARWYVLADEARGQFMRFDARTYAAIGRFDGAVTLQDVLMLVRREDPGFTEQELAGLVLQLANVSALRDSLPDDIKALTGNGASAVKKPLINPMALRFPLLDPDQFLDVAMPFVRPLFTRTAFVLWILTIFVALVLGVTQFNHLSVAVNANLLAPKSLLLGVMVFAVIKVIHEFAHAFAVKRWGGEVHEMGISLLVLMPIPYVDASGSWSFRDKRRRAFVGAVGILVELWVAAIALIVFLGVEPGFTRDVALTAFLVGGLSTLLINGNPLLRFDGYYVLQDLAELPNLSSRASRYLIYLVQRYGLSLDSAQSPVTAEGERRWFVVYGIAAGLYRLLILASIGLFLATKYLAVGVLLLCWLLIIQIILPISRALKFLFLEKQLAGRRTTAIARAAALPVLIVAVLAFVPVNQTTMVQGVVWLPEQSQLYANSAGVVDEILIAEGDLVEVGDPVMRLSNPDLVPQRKVLSARLEELNRRYHTAQFSDRAAADVSKEERKSITAQIEYLDDQIDALTIKSQGAGRITLSRQHSVLGSFVRQGDLVAHSIEPGDYIVRSVVPQRDIGRIRESVVSIEVRLAERLEQALSASIVRETPAGHSTLPSRALARAGGGTIETDHADRKSLQTVQQVFNIDLVVPQNTHTYGLGGRAFVRYIHEPKPLLTQWHDRLRQLLLRHLPV